MKKFQTCDQKAYKNNLDLFLTTLTKQVLVEPFHESPQEPMDVWQNLPKYTNDDINKAVLLRQFSDAIQPPYRIEVNSNFTEYLAFQEIPFFGAHLYFAYSPADDIRTWQNFQMHKLPPREARRLPLVSQNEEAAGGDEIDVVEDA